MARLRVAFEQQNFVTGSGHTGCASAGELVQKKEHEVSQFYSIVSYCEVLHDKYHSRLIRLTWHCQPIAKHSDCGSV